MGTRLKCSGRISSPKLLSLWKRVDIGHVSKRTKQAQLYHWKLISSAPSRPSLPKVLLLTFALDSLFPGGHRPWTQSLAKQESAVSEQAALPAQSRFRGSLCTRVRTHTRTCTHTHMHAHTLHHHLEGKGFGPLLSSFSFSCETWPNFWTLCLNYQQSSVMPLNISLFGFWKGSLLILAST